MIDIEEKRKRFQRLAPQRTNAIMDKIKILGNCANRSSYEYTTEEVNRIFTQIELSLEEAKQKFQAQKERKFRL